MHGRFEARRMLAVSDNAVMEQRVLRVTLADGTGLSYALAGAGPPLVYVTGWLTHLELSWGLPAERSFYETLAQGRCLVRYDRAGCGLSAPSTRPPSLAFELEQLAAVSSTLAAAPFDLVGTSLGALVAVAWAAMYPETVRRLVLYGGWANGRDLSPPGVQNHLLGLIESHWGLGSDVLTDIFAADSDMAMRGAFARYQREASSAATAKALLALSYELDVRDLLAKVRAPTLVVHRANDRAAPLAQAEVLADGITGSQLVVLPGRSHLPYVGDRVELVKVIRQFLGLRASRRSASVLTPRQREVAALVSRGCTNREIAALLGINERSAEGHVERIRTRLGVATRTQVAAWFLNHRDEQ